MSSDLSIAQVLTDLEAQVKQLEDQEAFHAQQEVFHREQRALRASELARIRERYETFKAAAAAAGEVVRRVKVEGADESAPARSLHREGRAMRDAVAADFRQVAGVEVVTLDGPLDDEPVRFRSAAAGCDFTLVIAPPVTISKMIGRILDAKMAGERLTPSSIAQEVNETFAKRLRRPVSSRTASVALRRLADLGRLALVREGKAFHEALYTKR